jgi:hypothetical protein
MRYSNNESLPFGPGTMNSTIGTLQDFTSATSISSTSAQLCWAGWWASAPLSAQTVGGTGVSLTLRTASFQGATTQNFCINRIECYVWRPSNGTKVGTLVAASSTPNTVATASGTAEVTDVDVFTNTTAVTCLDGDVLIFEAWASFTPSMAASVSLAHYFDGTTIPGATENAATSDCASYLEISSNLTFQPITTSAKQEPMGIVRAW